MEPAEERERAARARAGDRAAFEELVRVTARLLWAYVYGLVRDPFRTEDVVQETYLRAWAARGELRDPAAFRAWLFSIARRLAWRAREAARREAPGPPKAPEPLIPPLPETPEEDLRLVREALGRLPDRYRMPVTLRFLHGLPYETIGKMLDMPNGSLRGLIARGVRKLRAELAPGWRKRHEGT
ncbi:MAG: RNA polymerase sigma factor [Planctomycetota bacterium]